MFQITHSKKTSYQASNIVDTTDDKNTNLITLTSKPAKKCFFCEQKNNLSPLYCIQNGCN
jgi:hypothetical protein